MAHELSFKRGVAEVFSVRLPMWHQEGTIWTPEEATFDKAMETVGYEVVKRPTFRPIYGTTGDIIDYVQNQQAFVTVRQDTGKELGAVGAQYTVLQNRIAFAAMKPLLDQGILRLETGGVLRDGADAWLLGKFDVEKFGPVVREIFTDEVIPYALFTNNHNGRANATVAETPIRVVCANTLGAAEHAMATGRSKHVKVQHSGDAALRMVEAAEQLFGAIVERYEAIAEGYRLLKGRILTPQEYERAVVDVLAPKPQDNPRFVPDAKLAEMVVERAERKRAEIVRLWEQGDGHTGDHSAWEAYNAAAQVLDHNPDLFPIRGGTFRTAALLHGRLAELKGRVLTNVTKLAEGLTLRA